MPKVTGKKKEPDCVACNDTGINSRGEPCVPCRIHQEYLKTLEIKKRLASPVVKKGLFD